MKVPNLPHVENMQSNSGNDIANQFVIETKSRNYRRVFLQSYNSLICCKEYPKGPGKPVTYLDKERWDYSVTTGKYRNIFLNEGIADTRKKIESGEYKLTDLNEGRRL